MMDASQRTSCILPAGNPPAGHICICHEKSCFLERGSPVHSVPDTVTTSPRPGLPGRLKGSAKSFRSWKASLLLPEAWLDRLAQPGCPKWRWTSVLSLMVSGARHRKTIVFFFFASFTTQLCRCVSVVSDVQLLPWQPQKVAFLEGAVKTSHVTSVQWERFWERALTRSLMINGAAMGMTGQSTLSRSSPSRAGPLQGWGESTWAQSVTLPSSFYTCRGEGWGTWDILN